MKKTIVRVALVVVVHILLFELLSRLSVHRRESTGELLGMFLLVLLLAGLIWAVWAAFRRVHPAVLRIVGRSVLVLGLFVGTYTVDYFYYWHLRPNLGWYQEADWVAQHPGFQRELRARIQANLWASPKQSETDVSP